MCETVVWKDHSPDRKEYNKQINPERTMTLVPKFQLRLIRSDLFLVKLMRWQFGARHQLFFIPENDRTDARNARLAIVNAVAHVFGIGIEGLVNQWPWPYNAHVSQEYVEHLRQ